MPRRPKSRDPDLVKATNKAVAAWMRSDFDFDKIEAALGKPLNGDRRADLVFKLAFELEGIRSPQPPLRRAGRPTQNQKWTDLIVTLAAIFQMTHRRKPTATTWFAGNSETPSKSPFLKFVIACFDQVPEAVRPKEGALPTLIKRALSQRKAVEPWPMSREELQEFKMHRPRK